jgi:hypothetical protein
MPLDIDRAGLPEIDREAKRLVDGWCDRRCLVALRHGLSGWPLSSTLTDGWADFLAAMKNVRAFARDELTAAESDTVDDLIRVAERAVRRR